MAKNKKRMEFRYYTMPTGAYVLPKLGELLEYGILFTMDDRFGNLKWYGLGPDETYMDRDHAKLGVYRNRITDNMARYLRPRECGNKEKVRYTNHPNELPPVLSTFVRVSMAQMGVAGDDTWGALTHPEYLLDVSGKLSFTFSFRGIIN